MDNMTTQQTSISIFSMIWEAISRIIGTGACVYFGLRFFELAVQHELFKTDSSYSYAAFGSALILYSIRIMFTNINNSFIVNYNTSSNNNKEII